MANKNSIVKIIDDEICLSYSAAIAFLKDSTLVPNLDKNGFSGLIKKGIPSVSLDGGKQKFYPLTQITKFIQIDVLGKLNGGELKARKLQQEIILHSDRSDKLKLEIKKQKGELISVSAVSQSHAELITVMKTLLNEALQKEIDGSEVKTVLKKTFSGICSGLEAKLNEISKRNKVLK
ncbi:hypothetical protein YY92_08220 [Campylobacter fetus]|uniref:hypothetical protein n=1 Tax=Campylobacter fetus TaxID=196 RepID=UPI0011C9D5CE|nr:hypothetical protein [Campylobacter fetus]EAJ1232626.1 hypothetical protein [Campylobacter fetus]EAK0414695.1 hypothetical protein [Campylobacter fetus]TXF09189.1 hypothetical protein FPD25_03385 [Campylobacter fetus subsp. fetus]